MNHQEDQIKLIMAHNFFTFQVPNAGTTKNKSLNKLGMKKIDNYSYSLNDEIGLGFTSHVYRGKCDITRNLNKLYRQISSS